MVVEPASVRACVCPHFQMQIFLQVVYQIGSKFYQKHHWGGGKVASGFGPGRIRTLVFMATDISHRLTMRKTYKNLLL